MPIATNPETGETLYLDNSGQWKPAPTAVHPESKQELVFDGSTWAPLKREAQGPQQPTPSGTEAFGRGFTQAGSFGFRDELAGLAAAGGAAPDEQDPAATLAALARGSYRRLTGDPAAEQRYNAEVERQRAETQRYEREQPGASLGGSIAGAVAMPLPALRAATVGGRALQAAGIGAATGALSGLGEAEGTLAERLPHGVTGGLIGGAVGGVAAPVLEGGIAAGRYLARKPIDYGRAILAPGAQAEARIARAYAEAAAADPAAARRLTQADLGSGPAVVMDVLGQPGRNLARSAANLSGQARDLLEQTLEPRTAGQSHRLNDWFQQWMQHPDAHALQEAIDLAERTGNRTNYNLAMKQGDFPIRSDLLERLTGAPPVQRAMRDAAEAQQTRAISEGYGGFRSPVTITPDGQVVFNRGPGGVPTYPNLAFWDATRKQISDAARMANRAGRNEDASVLGNLARTINNELDSIVPSYQTARQGAANYFGASNALEAGQKFVGQDLNMAATRAALDKMNPTERKLFEDGFVSRIIEELGRHERVMSRTGLVQKLFDSPAARERMTMVMGKDRTEQLRVALHAENIMNQADRAVRGGSTTAQQLATAGLAGATGGYATGFDPTSSGLATALAVYGKGKVDQRVLVKIAEMLTSSDPKLIDRGIKMAARDGRVMSILREADAAVARVAGSQSGKRAP